jgi:peptidoglycan/LPS O-acetylase OafA/YrhL
VSVSAYAPAVARRDARLPVLDGVRGLAIVLVLINNVYPEGAAGSAFDTFIVHFTDFWWVGVDLFFVLSGFLITGILYDAREGAHALRNFYARRVLRIFPLYYGVLFVIFFIVPHTGFATADQLERLHRQEWYLWAYLGNLGQALHGNTHFRTDHFWSLAVEEQFYLVWPFLVLFLARRRVIRVTLALMAVSFVMRLVWCTSGMSYQWAYVLTPFRFDGLAVGSLVALTMRAPGGEGLEWLTRWAPRAWRVCAPLALALVAAFELPRSDAWGVVLQVIGYPIIAIAFGALIVLTLTADAGSRLRTFFGSPAMGFMGRYSYAIYVFHPFVVLFFMQRYGWGVAPQRIWGTALPAGLAFTAAVVAVSIAMAFASWHLYEKPFLALKRFVPYARAVRPAADGAPVRPPLAAEHPGSE